MVTSFVNETSTNHLENRLMLRGKGVTPPTPTSSYSGLLGSYVKTTLSVSPPPRTFVLCSHTPSLPQPSKTTFPLYSPPLNEPRKNV